MYSFKEKLRIFFENFSDYFNPSRHKKIWIGIVIACIILIPLILLSINLGATSPTGDVKAMKTYTDSLNYVKVRVPENWTTEEETATNTTGLNTDNPVTQQVEISQLYVPSVEGITIQVYQGTPACSPDQSLKTKLSGFPASYDDTSTTWTVPTDKATMVITVSYPGSNNVIHVAPNQVNLPQDIPTPVPQATAEQDKAYIMSILNTMQFTNVSPINCSS